MWQHANVTICSPLRDASANLPAYLARVQALEWPADQLRFIAVEGDSVDNTYAQLALWRDSDPRVTLLKLDCHQPHFGPTLDAARFKVLATVFNTALAAVDLDWTDYVLFLPADISYQSDLLQRLVCCQQDIIAPFVWQEGLFYDVWGFQLDGRSLGKLTRLAAMQYFGDTPFQLDTIGGTVLLSNAVLSAGCRYTAEQVDRGLCALATAAGFTIWAHPGVAVEHPPYQEWLD